MHRKCFATSLPGSIGIDGWPAADTQKLGCPAVRVTSIQIKGKETCVYLQEETRQEEDPRKHVEEVSHRGVAVSSWTSKVVTTFTECFSSICCCFFFSPLRLV